MAEPKLIPLATLSATLGDSHVIGKGPVGMRLLADVTEAELSGERVTASLVSPAAGDWLTMGPDNSYGTLDVRLTFKTDDDAIIHVEYGGRIDLGTGVAISSPRFQTGAESYEWLNRIQAIGVGQSSPGKVVYELYEVAVGD